MSAHRDLKAKWSLLTLCRVLPLLGLGAVAACGEIKTSGGTGDGGVDAPAGCATACGTNAACVAEATGYACRCAAGFVGDGTSCVNIDECAAGLAACDPLTKCIDRAPLYECTACPAGTLDMDPGINTKCQRDVPDSMQLLAPGAVAAESCGTVANADLDGDGVDGYLAAALLVNGATGKDAEGYGRNPTRPFKTIGYAISVADADPDRNQIYVASKDAAGAPIVYAEALRLPRGIALYGGYAADFKTRDPLTRTKVAPAAGVPFVADYTRGDVGGLYVVEGFIFEAAAAGPGASSIAAILQDVPAPAGAAADAGAPDAGADAGVPEARVRLINTTLIAKNGGVGADGRRPEPGQNGCPGKWGTPQNPTRTMGFESVTNCYQGSPGGYGGAAMSIVGEKGGDNGGVPGGPGGMTNSLGTAGCVCINQAPFGLDGSPGGMGAAAELTSRPPAPAQAAGTVVTSGGIASWIGAPGSAGAKGSVGFGGSGGGSSFGVCAAPGGIPINCTTLPGSSGGAGGGGGDGGPGGEGGLAGGASIGLLVSSANPSVACLSITTANGGNGGRGGAGALGGKGGNGGRGGDPFPFFNTRTGRGGNGGNGSEGRPGLAGQGGRGGLSAGVVLFNSVATGLDPVGAVDTNMIVVGLPGVGGPEITGPEPGYAGAPGIATRTLSLP